MLSGLELFTIGIGPSSSHTVGPMRAARMFVDALRASGVFERVDRVAVGLYGSLGATGRGHGSDRAVVLGLEDETPEQVDIDLARGRLERLARDRTLALGARRVIAFDPATDLVFHRRESLPGHANGMRFTAFAADGRECLAKVYYSVGGGFVRGEEPAGAPVVAAAGPAVPYPYATAAELLAHCARDGLSVSALMLANEAAWRPAAETRARLLAIWHAMHACIERGCREEGILPGGLKVRRRAPALYRRLTGGDARSDDPLQALDWVNLHAIATNEENAAGGRVVTAPTNGAAGIVPAVLAFAHAQRPGREEDTAVRFLLAAAAIGLLYKRNASISGAEVGCQGEVGVACSMAAAGLAEVLGGTPAQVENAAEIGMEHNLGLTCDPIGGLVQVPCIERNAMGAMKAINAARLALAGDGTHRVSLDEVIETMRQTGADMLTKYKETSRGGLAVNVIEC